MEFKDDQLEPIFQLALEYVAHSLTEDKAEDPDEWKYDSEEKFNAVYDAYWNLLGAPSLAEIQQSKSPAKKALEVIHLYSDAVGKATFRTVHEVQTLLVQGFDIPIEDKAKTLVNLARGKDDIELDIGLKNAKYYLEQMRLMEKQGLFND